MFINRKTIFFSITINLLLAGLLLYFLISGNKVLPFGIGNSNKNVSIFMPDIRQLPPYCDNYFELLQEFKTEPNTNIIEKKIKKLLNEHVCDEYYYLLGRIEEKRNNLEKALDYYKKATKVFPLRSYFLRIAMIYKLLGNEDRKELALDKASLTIGNTFFYPNDEHTGNIAMHIDDSLHNIKAFNRPIKINEIVSLIKSGNITEAFLKYKELIKYKSNFHYEYDRMLKFFTPYFFSELNKNIYTNWTLSYWQKKFRKKVRIKKLYEATIHKTILDSEEIKISYFAYELSRFTNNLIMSCMDYRKNNMIFKGNLLTYRGFTIENLFKRLNSDNEYLSERKNENIQAIISFIMHEQHNWKYGKVPSKEWTEGMIKSF